MKKEFILCMWIVIFIGYILIAQSYQITPPRAKSEIATLIGTDDFKIIKMSNNNLFVGTPGDVTFNLKVKDSVIVSCRCTDDLFQPLICRKYE